MISTQYGGGFQFFVDDEIYKDYKANYNFKRVVFSLFNIFWILGRKSVRHIELGAKGAQRGWGREFLIL